MRRAPQLADLQRIVLTERETPKPSLGSRAHPQLDLPEMIERERSIGIAISRRNWLEQLEVLTKDHRTRLFAKHMLMSQLSLEIPGTERAQPAVDPRKLKDMRKHGATFDPEGLSLPALEFWRQQLQRERQRDRSGHDGPLRFGATSVREQKLAELELALEADPDRRRYKRPVEGDDTLPAKKPDWQWSTAIYQRMRKGDWKYEHGGNMTGHAWHQSRAKGQIDRFEKVRQCGGRRLIQHCAACNQRGPKINLTCDNVRLCLSCRKRHVLKFQKRFSSGQKSAMQELWRLQLTKPTRIVNGKPLWGGQWDQKLITLTLPHSGHVTDDVAELPKAWRRMWRLLQEHLVKDVLGHCDDARELMTRIRYCRVIEVTEGLDGKGHAHLHIWFVGPYVDQARIAHLWGTSLSKRYQDLLMVAAKRAGAGVAATDEDTNEPCACGIEHERATGVQSVELAMERLRCRLKRNRVSDRAIESIEARERSWYMTKRPNAKGYGGKPLVLIWKPVVDVRACDKDIADELCKYLIKDGKKVNGQLELMDPTLYAQIYAALEGRRAIACTRGLLAVFMSEGCHCKSCGSVYQRWIESGVEKQTGPPAQAALQVVS